MLGDSQAISHLKIASGFFSLSDAMQNAFCGHISFPSILSDPEADNTEFIVPERGRKPYNVTGLKVKQV